MSDDQDRVYDQVIDLMDQNQKLEAKLKLAEEALDKLRNQDRTRGYPTGSEWGQLMRIVGTALAELRKA